MCFGVSMCIWGGGGQMGRNTYGEGEGDSNVAKAWEERGLRRAELFDKGQSRRIWAELYKVRLRRGAERSGGGAG